ncbi:MAG: Gfo/Idh/MocA family oxidoreductase, partial [Candidatus Bathyarchaeia archaeon]
MLKLGFIGCGSISYEHVRRLSILDEGEACIKALCDVKLENAEKLRIYANRFRNTTADPIPRENIFMDYREMLDSVELDAVIICTPHTMHYEHVMESLKRGLHVLVEKPMAVSLREAEEMASEASRRSLVLAVGYQRHFDPVYTYVRDMVLGGKLGDPHFIVATLYQNLIAAGRWYLDPKLSGGGQLKASGTHLVDLILWITEREPVKVKALMDRCGTDVDLYIAIAAELSGGVLASIAISGAAPGTTASVDEEFRLWCSRGAIFVLNGRVYVQDRSGDTTMIDRGRLPRIASNPDLNFV